MRENVTIEERKFLQKQYEQARTNYAELARVLNLNPSVPWLALNKGYVTPKLRKVMRDMGIGLPERVKRGAWFTRDEAKILDMWRATLGVSWADVIKMGISSYVSNKSKTGSAKRMIEFVEK